MKKILFTTVLASLLFFSESFAQEAPELSFSVLNISQENKDAQSIGAREGDVLRYEVVIKSQNVPVSNYSTTVDVVNVQALSEIMDTGLGELNGNSITFPTFSQAAPCEKVFTFFARVKPCSENAGPIVATANGKTTTVPLNCGLVQTGPSSKSILMLLFVGFAAMFMFFSWKRV